MVRDHIADHDLDILIITETWLKKNTEERVKAELLPQGYAMVHQMRSTKKGGGVAVVYKSNLIVKPVTTSPQPTSYELMEVLIKQNHHCLSLFVVYCPEVRAAFHDDFGDLLTGIAASPSKALIVGDFNIHWDTEDDPDAKRLRSTLDEAACVQHVNWPTHVAGHTLDLIISREKDNVVESAWASSLLSDHLASHGRLYISKPPLQKREVTARCFKRIDQDAFSNDLTNLLQTLGTETDIENRFQELSSSLRSVLDSHAPLVTKMLTVRPNCQWMNDTILAAKREKRRSERRWRKTELNVDLQSYKEKRDHLTSLIQKAKTQFEEARIQACGNDQRALFALTKRLMSSEKSKCPLSPVEMSHFFENKISVIRNSLATSSLQPEAFDGTATSRMVSFTLVTEDDVAEIIRKSPSKSCDLDPLPTWLLKKHLPLIIRNITQLLNLSLAENKVPDMLKKALVRPTLKKPSMNPNDPQSYRPVSNLPFLTKVLERVVCRQLTKFLDDNQLHHPFQSAYRAGHSVETALLKVQNDIAAALDQKKYVVLVLLDLSAAFDMVDHPILIQRMYTRFGVRDDVLQWMTSYLSGWRQSVKIGDDISPSVTMQCGVPQGSVLGPILFSLYVCPLIDIASKHGIHTHQYADDCQLYISAQMNDADALNESKMKVEDCICEIAEWMAANKLKLNDGKSEVIVFAPPNTQIPQSFNTFSVGEKEIESGACVKDLGVYFNEHLNAERQVNALCASSYYHLSNISALRNCLSRASVEKLMHAFVMTKLDFCNSLLMSIPQRLLDKVQRLQNSAARIVTRTPKRHHITPVLRELHWLPVRERMQYKVATMTWQCVYGKAPEYLKEMLTLYEPTRDLRSTGDRLLIASTPRTAIGRRAFSHFGPTVWNQLPQFLRKTVSFNAFKKDLKTFLFTCAYN